MCLPLFDSERAVKVNIEIVRAFVRLGQLLAKVPASLKSQMVISTWGGTRRARPDGGCTTAPGEGGSKVTACDLKGGDRKRSIRVSA
jgi:hypothetical protein